MTQDSIDQAPPSEIALAKSWMSQEPNYKGCRHYWLDDAERLRWWHSSSPVLAGFQVFSCGQFVEAWGHMWERDKRSDGVLIYCLDGMGYYQTNDNDWVLNAGDLLYAPPDTHYLYWADGKRPWSIYWMHLSGPHLSHYESILGLVGNGPVHHPGIRPEIIAEFDRLLNTMPSNAADPLRWLSLQAAALSILGHIAVPMSSMAETASAHDSIRRAIAVMNDSLESAFDMTRFARAAKVSPRHFVRLFKRVTGSTPANWFNQRKMQNACSQLTAPDIRVKEVAARLGYADPLHFSRVFHRVLGMSPEQYRRKMAEKTAISLKSGAAPTRVSRGQHHTR